MLVDEIEIYAHPFPYAQTINIPISLYEQALIAMTKKKIKR